MSDTPAKPKKTSLGLKLVFALFGLALAATLAAIGFVAWVVRTAQVDNDRALAAARAAPGTAELRALGCQTASARDDVSTTPDGAALFTVDCEVAAGTKLSCADVAKAYTKAVGKAKAPFRVTVGPSSGSEHLCTESFSTDGQPLQGKP